MDAVHQGFYMTVASLAFHTKVSGDSVNLVDLRLTDWDKVLHVLGNVIESFHIRHITYVHTIQHIQ